MAGPDELPFDAAAPPCVGPTDDGRPADASIATPTTAAPSAEVPPAPVPAPRAAFQASAGIQGRQFAEQCDTLLAHLGFELRGRVVLDEVGVEIDQHAVSPRGVGVWFEYKGSVQGHRPGLRRTDTVKKAIANGALLRGLADPAPYVIVTSHLPEAGAGAAMLATALHLGYLADVICLYDPAATTRLTRW